MSTASVGAPRELALGIDVSAETGAIPWSQVSGAGVVFAYAITSVGTSAPDARFAENWDAMDTSVTLEQYREYAQLTIAALNHALQGIPDDRVRYHMCWGSWHGPHVHDIELRALVDLLLEVKAQAYLIEGANARHDHEWAVWKDVQLPDGVDGTVKQLRGK